MASIRTVARCSNPSLVFVDMSMSVSSAWRRAVFDFVVDYMKNKTKVGTVTRDQVRHIAFAIDRVGALPPGQVAFPRIPRPL